MSENYSVFISSIFMMLSVFIFGKILSNKKIVNKKMIIRYIILIIGAIVLHTIIFLQFNGLLKTLLLCAMYSAFLYCTFSMGVGKSIVCSIIYTLLMVIPDLITLAGVIYIFNLTKEQCYNTVAGGIISNLSVTLIMTLITYILRKPLRKLINMNISSNKKLIAVSLLILIAMSIFFYNLIKTFQFNDDIAGFLIAIFALITIFFYIFKQKMDNNNMLKKYDNLLDIMKNYESDIEEQRTLIHETRNELTTIRGKIKDKEKESEIIEYIDSIMGDKVSSNMSRFSKFKYLPSNGLKGFFYYKFTEAERKGINVSVNISKQIENSFLGKLDTKNFKDLARIIGVYVDNAIEASSISDEKKLGIEMYLINNNIDIIISNTYANDIDEEKVGKERYSTKGKYRGHGLLLVRRILNDNKIITSKNEITDKLYIQKIKIKNDKKEKDQ